MPTPSAICDQAIVLVGGEGTRLRPITSRQPKPAAPVVCRPFIGYVLEHLARHGVRHVVFSTGYLAEAIEAAVGDGSAYGVHVTFALEDTPLGTAGAIRHAASKLHDGPFLALNGDVLTDVDVSALVGLHTRSGAAATLHLTPVDDPRRYGLVRLAVDGRVTEFLEKPGMECVGPALINAGVYVLEPRVLDLIPAGRAFSIERGVFPTLVAEESLYGYASHCYWRDIGTPESYLAANFAVLDGSLHTAVGTQLGPGYIHVAQSAVVQDGARVVPPAWVDAGVTLGAGCRVGPRAVIGRGSVIGERSVVEESVVQDDVRLEDDVSVRYSVIVRGCRVGSGTQLSSSILGEQCLVGARNEFARGLRLAPAIELPDASVSFGDPLDGEERT